jgi:hypothetical protein
LLESKIIAIAIEGYFGTTTANYFGGINAITDI